jgi:hypothetical protein
LAGACESQHEATPVAIGRPGHHRPGLCCVVVLSCCRVVDAGPKPTASAPARPLHPAAGARGHGPVARAGHVHPTTGRSTVALTPWPVPLQLRKSDACGGPGPGAQRAPTRQQLHLRHRGRLGSRACSDWSPGVGPSRCPAASMEGGPPAPFKKAGRAAGAIELNLLLPPALLHVRLSRLAPYLFSFNFLIGSLSSLAPPKEGFCFLGISRFKHVSYVTISLACRRYLSS